MKNKSYPIFSILVLLAFSVSACSSAAVPALPIEQPVDQPAQPTVSQPVVGNTSVPGASTAEFTLTSPDVADGGRLPVEYTCDGGGSTLALAWSGANVGQGGQVACSYTIK